MHVTQTKRQFRSFWHILLVKPLLSAWTSVGLSQELLSYILFHPLLPPRDAGILLQLSMELAPHLASFTQSVPFPPTSTLRYSQSRLSPPSPNFPFLPPRRRPSSVLPYCPYRRCRLIHRCSSSGGGERIIRRVEAVDLEEVVEYD